MKYLGIDEVELEKIVKGLNTAMEIERQPDLWKLIFDSIVKEKESIQEFLNIALSEINEIILTGAGTSAYIGLSLEGTYWKRFQKFTHAIATTDLVTTPNDYVSKETVALVISFARSGNSPESIGALNMVEKHCKKCFHLIITCDFEGKLAQYETRSPKYVFLLPSFSNDLGLAMTSSFTGMLLSGLLITRLNEIDYLEATIEKLCLYGRKIISGFAKELYLVSKTPIKRAVFLGSGQLFGIATESALKLQELTDGMVICKSETYLGFRHGPKAVVDKDTLVCYLFTNDDYVSQYEMDLIHSMENGQKPLFQIAIGESIKQENKFDLIINLSDKSDHLENDFFMICAVIPAQILGFYKCINLGLFPDQPSKSNSISRVVKGVKIYDNVLKVFNKSI